MEFYRLIMEKDEIEALEILNEISIGYEKLED